MSAAAIPPAAVRSAPLPTDQAATPPGPGLATPAAPAARPATTGAQAAQEDHQAGVTAGGALTAALFVGAGLAIAFCPFLAPFLCLAGAVTGIDFLGDVVGMSPVKMLTGKSIGGWIASAFTPRPSEPNRQAAGFNMRAQPQPDARPRVVPGDDQPRGQPLPEPVPTS